jgi:alpha-N-acetylglucosaminidase
MRTMDTDLKPIYDLAQRMVPWLLPHLQFHLIDHSAGESDSFELYSGNNLIHIAGTSIPSLGMGLNHFLKYYCHRSASHCGDNLQPPDSIPSLKNKIKISTPFHYRYALNYCTFSYTMAFWTWKQWEKELDWMALNGVNLMLVTTGSKAVWQKVLEQCGYTNNEIHEFLPGPAYDAWWLMGNLEGWGGTSSQELINQQFLLAKKILQRMQELGIEPVYHGFYGMVPHSLKNKFPEIAIVEQGKWNNVFDRPDILVCTSEMFGKIARLYYKAVKELYGEFLFFSGDPFHEGGSTKGLDVKKEATAIYDAMQEAVPKSTWVLQAWYGNPKQELLDGLTNREHILILDLFGEVTIEWKTRDAFGGTPFIWCSINNFGERNGLYGRLEKIASGPAKAQASSYSRRFMKGVGAVPEGICNNPVVYDMIFDAAWRPGQFNVKEWLPEYTWYRYGKKNEQVIQAWYRLLDTVYSSSDEYREGSNESVFCARPSLNVTGASTWSTRYLFYDNSLLEEAALLFLSASEELGDRETYRYDLIDMTRQIIANYGQMRYDEIVRAFNEKDIKSFNKYSKSFLELILQQDELLSSHPAFMLGRWLKKARGFRNSDAEKDLCEWNARVLITWWGPDDPATMLKDYANKEWAGLLKDFYYPRWKIFLETVQWQLMGFDPAEINYFSFEKNWAQQRKTYPVSTEDNCINKARKILEKTEKPLVNLTKKI